MDNKRYKEVLVLIEALKDYLRWMDEQEMNDSRCFEKDNYLIASRLIARLRMERDFYEATEEE